MRNAKNEMENVKGTTSFAKGLYVVEYIWQ